MQKDHPDFSPRLPKFLRIQCRDLFSVHRDRTMCQRGRIVQKILNGGRYKTFFCICTCAAIFISAVYGAVDQHQAEVFSAYILGAFVFAAFHRSKRNSILRICALDLRSAE